MKLQKSPLVITVTIILFAVSALAVLIITLNAKKQETRQEQYAAATPDTASPQAGLAYRPILKINDLKDNPDIYLQSLYIRVEVTGNIASTRYTMTLKNKTYRVLEGVLTFPIPAGRSVNYYALDIDGKMREGVPVEKARGTEVFEAIVQRSVDPGLLEKADDNNYRTRIYPFAAYGTRTISIGYDEELTPKNDSLQYRLPIAYPDSLERFSITATVFKSDVKPIVTKSDDELRFDKNGEDYTASFVRQNYRPNRELSFTLPAPADSPRVLAQHTQGRYYFLASVTPRFDPRKKIWDNDLAIIWDVSLSATQRDLKRELEILNIIFTDKKDANVHLYFLNNKLKKMVNKNTPGGEYKVSGGKWSELKNVLDTAVFDGGTDFSQINLNDITGNEILFFSDGVSTLSDADSLENIDTTRQIHCFASSANIDYIDYNAMKRIADKTNGKFVNVNALSYNELKDVLLNETPRLLWVWWTIPREKPMRRWWSTATSSNGNFSLIGASETNKDELTLLFGFGFGDTLEKRIKVPLDAKNTDNRIYIRKLQAQKKIAELDLYHKKNRAEITDLGRQFGIVTRYTSLIVLESMDDYTRYRIEPPPPVSVGTVGNAPLNDGGPISGNKGGGDPRARVTRMGVLGLYSKRNKDWRINKDAIDELPWNRDTANQAEAAAVSIKNWLNTEFSTQKITPNENNPFSDTGTGIAKGGFAKTSSYMYKLTGELAKDYQTYLAERNNNLNLPVFYYDMANWFYAHGDRETALRILTSIADLELENASLYRMLGYRLKEYGEYALEKFVCQKVIQWRPADPQSYRDYANALADNGETQAALDSLYSLLWKKYPENTNIFSPKIEETVITEINHLIAKNANLNKSKISKRLLINIPVDVRVVINWNTNGTDVDLQVKDPNNEWCYANRRQTSIGGRISADIRNGYGPEQFLLKKAIKGKYRVYVNYYGNGNRYYYILGPRVAAAEPTTVMAEIYTKYADKTEQRRIVCLQFSKAREIDGGNVLVAEFEI